MSDIIEFRVIVFGGKNEKQANKYLDGVISKYCIEVYDWIEKDYGLMLFVKLPKCYRSEVRSELGNIQGVTYEEC